jgi:uncharacterized membrane protein YoaK (UPF0700 family)
LITQIELNAFVVKYGYRLKQTHLFNKTLVINNIKMFRHKGKSRSFKQNIGIASLLALVAGMVNVVGFLSVQKLTTNVTGHFAFMIEEANKLNLGQTLFYFFYILSFFLGAFFSNFIIEFTNKITDKYIFIIPIITESFILGFIGFWNQNAVVENSNLIACGLLFAMGLQNSLVTTISNSVVRTTHLTGLFTDLGIEVSQLFFSKYKLQRNTLTASIKLRLTIITTFFVGGIFAGFMFSKLEIKTLLIPAILLIGGLVIDYLLIVFKVKKNKNNNKKGI